MVRSRGQTCALPSHADRELASSRDDIHHGPFRRTLFEGTNYSGEPIARDLDGSSCANAESWTIGGALRGRRR